MAVLELVKNKQVVAKQSNLFEDIRIYRVYSNEENESSIVKEEEKDELNLNIEKNITEQIEEKAEGIKQENNFDLEEETIDLENTYTEDNDGKKKKKKGNRGFTICFR